MADAKRIVTGVRGGLGRLQRRAVRVVRNDPRLRKVAYAAVDAVVGKGPVTGVRGGSETVSATDADAWPVVLVVVLRASAERTERLARQAAELQAVGVGFRPLFLVDDADFAPLRQRGYAAEYIAPCDGWADRGEAGEWTTHFAARLRECREAYAPVVTVMLPAMPSDAASDESALWDREMLSGAAVSAASAGVQTSRLTTLRRWVDRSR